MIYRLQKKFILISTVSVLSVVLLVFALITAFNVATMNRNLDLLADRVSAGGGRFPELSFGEPPPKKEGDRHGSEFNFINPETPFSTRHFTVWFDESGEIVRVNTESIHALTDGEAEALAAKTVRGGRTRGWASSYRYKIFSTEAGSAIVFIDGSMSRSSMLQSVSISAAVLVGCAALVLLLIVLLSKRVVKPIAESYERQRQFVTDANHELKTPLTLILANLDIAESELGENEWLADIRTEGHRMTELVNRLVELSRMDEECDGLLMERIPLGELVEEAVEAFRILAERRQKHLTATLGDGVSCIGDAQMLRRLLALLLDNAVKYCDEGGEIRISLTGRRQAVLTVENTYAAVSSVDPERLFDRFYRADRARGAGGFGIGLSTARAIVERLGGEITAYKKDATHIGFQVILKG